MSRFQANPKQTSSYPTLLSRKEEIRKRGLINTKLGRQNKSFSGINSQLLQRFSGKRGK